MEPPGKAESSRTMAVNSIHDTRFHNRKRKVMNNGSKDTKKLIKERKSIIRTKTKGDEKKCRTVALKKQDESNINSISPITDSVDGSEKVVDGSEKVVTHSQTDEKSDCKRKPSDRCMAKQKLANSANDASSDQRTQAEVLNEKIAKHTTIVKTRVDGRERAMFQCGYCNKWRTNVALKSNMLAHLEKHETGVLRCGCCGHDAVNVPALDEHVARVHTRQPQFVCALCGKACFSRKQLRQHEDIHNLHPRDCRHCGQTMRSLAQLKKHTKTEHGGDGLYSCDECRKTFVFKTWFDAHKARQACGLRATCSLCGAEVVKGGGMSAHMRRVHAGEKRELCSYCPFTAFTKTQVRLHERTHTRDHPFTCHLCPFSAAKKYQLTSHMRTHTGEKPFHCDQCPFASSWKVQLRAHQAAHTSATAVTCDACAVVCKDAWSLGVHKLREHGQSASNQKRTTQTKPTTGCETRNAVAPVVDVTSAGSCQLDKEATVEQAADGSDEVTSYIIVDEAVAKDIERLGLETVALVLLDDTTDGATITTQNPSSGEATQHIEVAHVPSDVTGEPAEVTEEEHPSVDIVIEECEHKIDNTASETELRTLKLADVEGN